MGKGNSSNFKIGWDRGVSVPGAFKLDHLQPFEPILSQKIFNFFTFILGGQFLLPQRANMQKRKFSQLQNWMRQRGLTANSLSGQTKIIWSSVSHRKKRANSVPCSAAMSTNRRWQGRREREGRCNVKGTNYQSDMSVWLFFGRRHSSASVFFAATAGAPRCRSIKSRLTYIKRV